MIPHERLAERVAAVLRSAVFDAVCYCRAANLSEDTDPAEAIADYLLRGEDEGFRPHDLFDPQHVLRQLQGLGIAPIDGSALLTYLADPDLPIDPHPLFDHAYYDQADATVSCLEDYLRRRSRGELPPSPHVLFDREFYYGRYPDVAERKSDAFLHYLRGGWKENRQPHPLFDPVYWERDLAARGVEQDSGNPLIRYCTNRTTWPARTHALFDPECLDEQMQTAGMVPSTRHPPLARLLLHCPDLSGNRLFDPSFYRAQARVRQIDLAEHPLVNYVKRKNDGRLDPHPLFCESYYTRRYPEAVASAGSALEHFVRRGQAGGCDPNPLFSQKYYRSANPAVADGESRLLEHYIANGRDLLDPHALFDASSYAARYPECLRQGDTPLGHYSRAWAENGMRFPPWGTALFPRRQAPRDFRVPEVVLVSHDLTRTGAPLILLRIVQHLVGRRGLRALVLAAKGGELLEDFCEWAPTVDLSLARRGGFDERQLLAEIRASFEGPFLPRLIIVNTACIDYLLGSLAGDAPVVTLVHELASGFPEAAFRNIYDGSELVVYPAEFVRNEAHVRFSLPVRKAAVLSQGLLDPDFGQGDPQPARAAVLAEIEAEPDAFVVLGCGTLDLRKGLDTFVHVALAALRGAEAGSSGRPVHFVWIGGGPTGPQTVDWFAHQDIDRSGMAGRIHLLGPRTNAEPYFAACDAFVMTSRMDPFPCVVHEAMACGKPIVALSDAGGISEALCDGAGIAVGYGDVVAMAQEVLKLRGDPNRARAIGTRAREVVRTRYVFSDYVDRILSTVEERLGVAFPEPPRPMPMQAQRRRIVVALGETEPARGRRFAQWLVEGLLERGFDAELLYTGDPRALRWLDEDPALPCRILAPSNGLEITCKHRWDALARVLEVAAPAVLVHNLDPIASAFAPVPCPGTGILGIIHGGGQEYLEQAARLGRYWQRAVATGGAVARRVLEAAPFLAGRLVEIPHVEHRHPAPERRTTDRPLGIVTWGGHPRPDSSMPFLVPLVRGLQAAGLPFTMTLIVPGPEEQLLQIAASAELIDGRIRLVKAPAPAELAGAVRAGDVLVRLHGDGSESIGLAEAMQAGLTVIDLASDADADELLRDGVNGYRLGQGGVQACLSRLLRLAADRDLLERLRAAAHGAVAETADKAGALDAYARLLDEMLEELRSRTYEKPPPLYLDPVLGALSLPPMFRMDRRLLGYGPAA